jgi:hypothetical protein
VQKGVISFIFYTKNSSRVSFPTSKCHKSTWGATTSSSQEAKQTIKRTAMSKWGVLRNSPYQNSSLCKYLVPYTEPPARHVAIRDNKCAMERTKIKRLSAARRWKRFLSVHCMGPLGALCSLNLSVGRCIILYEWRALRRAWEAANFFFSLPAEVRVHLPAASITNVNWVEPRLFGLPARCTKSETPPAALCS